MKNYRVFGIIAALAMSSLLGCATAGKMITPAYVTVVQGAVDFAVGTAISKGVPAAGIKMVAQELLAIDNGGNVSLATVEAALNAKIALLNLPPADMAGVALLTQSLEAMLNQKISSGTKGVTSTTTVAIAEVLNDVINATSFYGV